MYKSACQTYTVTQSQFFGLFELKTEAILLSRVGPTL